MRNAHKLIVEYQERILHIIEFIKNEVHRGYDIFHYPREEMSRAYGDITEFFFGAEKGSQENKEKNAFIIILATGNNENEPSEFIFILDQKYGALPKDNLKKREYDIYNIINGGNNKEGCQIQRINIENFYDEEALKNEWKRISNNFAPCWINTDKGIREEGYSD